MISLLIAIAAWSIVLFTHIYNRMHSSFDSTTVAAYLVAALAVGGLIGIIGLVVGLILKRKGRAGRALYAGIVLNSLIGVFPIIFIIMRILLNLGFRF